ncbi:rod shape-determining protein MreC [Saccharophagus sp. K07]|uniref:rod shape-determining protein MreC n=1 Tax=Saccharophagus sp. K07 TaxID=2283636 RepID=UPI001651DDA8|nr:rod shape-determining protein MreC [Saccharophagus sp. K07]MBC6907283.1 rod shape-determining protein MreC [Saccharophagus sp. K07]
MFAKGPSPGARLTVLALLALAIALIYSKTTWLDGVRQRLVDVTVPIYWLADIPGDIGRWSQDRLASKVDLQEENRALRTEVLVLKRKLQQMAALTAENTRLRQLLNSADTIEDRVLVAELIGVSPDPMKHKVMINRGTADGVYIGQPVVDAYGLVGQVVEVGKHTGRVLLITDSSHALPVQINRNGIRLVAEGQGNLFELQLRFVSSTMDIQEGDLLVTSGLGQRFPPGYPVAQVEKVTHDPGKPFATVTARPMAELNRNRHVLLVFDRHSMQDEPAAPASGN